MTTLATVRPERRRDIGTAFAVAGAVLLICLLAKLADPLFTFWGDNSQSFAPLWHHLGTELRAGHWTAMDPTAWAGGNYAAEAAYGVMNPVSLANFVLLSFFNDLAAGMFVIMAEFLALLAVAVFLLARSYGAVRPLAAAFAVAVPFGGFTLFYGADNWASGLMALTWTVWFWWAAHRYIRTRLNPIIAFVLGALAISVGNPYSILGVVCVLVALAADLAVHRQWRRLGGLVVLGACVGTIAALVYLPLVQTLAVTGRQATDPVFNDGYLTPDLQDLVGMSSPTFQPSMPAWFKLWDYVPSTYFVWFAAPLLPWIRWRTATRNWRALVSPLTFMTIMILFTVGPSKIWLFRWPIRLVEYVWVALAVVLAVMLSHGRARSYLRARWILSGAIVAFGFFDAWAVTPFRWTRHLAAALAVAALLALALYLWRRSLWTACAALIAGIAVVAPLQVSLYSWNHLTLHTEADIKAGHDLSLLRESTAAYRGTVLQLGSKEYLPPDTDAVSSGRLLFGNTPDAIGLDTIGSYSGIGLPAFQHRLCMDYQGSIGCNSTWQDILEPVGPAYDASIVDALGVDTLVYSTHSWDTYALEIPEGWQEVLRDDDRYVVTRPELTSSPVVTPSRGVEVADVTADGAAVTFTTTGEGGTVLLDRLAWPGYTAVTADGEELTVQTGPVALLEIAVPAGTTQVTVDFQSPGLRAGAAIAAVGAATAVAHSLLYALRGGSRRSRRNAATRRHAAAESSSATI